MERRGRGAWGRAATGPAWPGQRADHKRRDSCKMAIMSFNLDKGLQDCITSLRWEIITKFYVNGAPTKHLCGCFRPLLRMRTQCILVLMHTFVFKLGKKIPFCFVALCLRTSSTTRKWNLLFARALKSPSKEILEKKIPNPLFQRSRSKLQAGKTSQNRVQVLIYQLLYVSHL